MLESMREDRLFNDHLAKHLIGERGERISLLLDKACSSKYDIKNFLTINSAVRTKIINDHLELWVDRTIKTG